MTSSPDRSAYEIEVEGHLLALREALVRHDENEKALILLDRCVPYWLLDNPRIMRVQADQQEMCLHLIDPAEYQRYYADNPHERPFEEQYRMSVDDAGRMPRVGLLEQWLEPNAIVLDLAANDGWMASYLSRFGHSFDCLDLNPQCVERARGREGVNRAECGDLIDADEFFPTGHYDAVTMFEVIEHVPDVDAALQAAAKMVRPGGTLYVSTPNGAVERGNVPNWDHVERKGHVRAIRPQDLQRYLEQIGRVVQFIEGPDRVLVAAVEPR
jgi:2-polyprenyl-3-methyl-5-hydroxy-6-metoxy-1,4-benzoquinol methylase